MELIERKLPDNHEIIICTCTHEGTIFQHSNGIREMIDYVESGNNHRFLIHLGDAIEAISVDDPRFDINSVDGRSNVPIVQSLSIARKFEPIKDSILAWGIGNHEWKLQKYGNLAKDVICRTLGCRYGSYSYKLIIKDGKGKLIYKLFATHGAKGISSVADRPVRRKANMKLQLQRHLAGKAGDCIVMVKGHAHKLVALRPQEELFLTDDGKRVKQSYKYHSSGNEYIDQDLRWYGCAGSFLKLYVEPMETIDPVTEEVERVPISGYAERFELDPVELGFLKLVVQDRQVVDLQEVRL